MAGLSLAHVALTTSTTTISWVLLINYSSEIVLPVHPSQPLPSKVADSLYFHLIAYLILTTTQGGRRNYTQNLRLRKVK